MKRLDESFNLGKNKVEVDTNKLMLIITKKGKTREIDLTLVEKLALEYEEILFRRKNFQDRRHIDYSIKILEEIKKLDREQLKYFITYLTGLTNRLSDLYQSAQDNPEEFCKRIKEYNNLFGKAKEISNRYTDYYFKEGPIRKGGLNTSPKTPKPDLIPPSLE